MQLHRGWVMVSPLPQGSWLEEQQLLLPAQLGTVSPQGRLRTQTQMPLAGMGCKACPCSHGHPSSKLPIELFT